MTIWPLESIDKNKT